ncbi:tRNA preQ1(34) S-adenosylmethionine ribosyltransferase-isomerase QueA [Paraphotobacterium marinum]|uniref:S-adenosylmethionine:tRNA ribosyltransferase-isomerase n=1 Tax=Paraphotobacterium marinum TaxID=1755811 RepID=A0A220VDS6_9GAMM|nr:tRNA preQ1(34) S-adenosylmethionine ribosyltransferase-isomerase QueA [Paraphotobacterium marinum]ASK78431.1 tRNA preQ1(34) S-adenosylmethionine ribosyltransferase-isomerase QueA [Paraphotobacterium marinum]
MKRSKFFYELPKELIASKPAKHRTDSRLLMLDSNNEAIYHKNFVDVLDLVQPGDLLVFNNTKVMPARLFAVKETGGKVEILIERVLDNNKVLVHLKSSNTPKKDALIFIEADQNISLKMIERKEDLFILQFENKVNVFDTLEKFGHMPLPPYIERPDTDEDKNRYQTVYGEKVGAVAAPTAGLHFDQDLLDKLKEKGVNFSFVTLHVGAGTFKSVKSDDIEDHQMHSEYIDVSKDVVQQILNTKKNNKRIIAVGTTSVRALESAAKNSLKTLESFTGDTDIFIYPGYKFKVVDAMITNFHLPESTLLMLVSAFSGYQNIMEAYQKAIEKEYRFFSYGDAMFITKNDTHSSED